MVASSSCLKRLCYARVSISLHFRVTRLRFAASETCSRCGRWPAQVVCRLRAPRPPPVQNPCPSELRLLRQQPLDLGGDSLVARGDLRWPSAGQLAVRGDQVFVKVPAWHAGLAEFCRNPLVKWMCFATDNPAFFGERKVDGITGGAETFDLGGRSRLLRPEIV